MGQGEARGLSSARNLDVEALIASDNDKLLSSKEMVRRAREAFSSPPDRDTPPEAAEGVYDPSSPGVVPDGDMPAVAPDKTRPDRGETTGAKPTPASRFPPRSFEYLWTATKPREAGPISGGVGRRWGWFAALASTLIVAGALVIPLLVDAFSSSTTTIWVTDPSELPAGIGAAVLDDYSLETDFEGTVLVAAGITLDCAGHTIRGNGVGVLLSEESTLRGCDVVGPGAGVGVGGRGVTIEDLVVRGVDVGVVVEPEGTLDCGDSTISGSDPVVGIYPQDGAMITNCRVSGFNTAVGLGGSRDVIVEGVYATGNRIGFYLVNGSTGIRISDSTAEDNEIGFLFERSVTNVTVERNHALQNWGAGFQIGHTTSSLFTDNEVEGGGSGFWLTQSHDNRFEGNTVSNASQWFSIGLERSSSRNLFVANEVSGGGVGIAVFGGASNNQFVENSLHHNAKGAHTEAGTGGNTFSGNLVYDNSHVGLWDDTTGARSRYSANECSNNADANSVPDGLC